MRSIPQMVQYIEDENTRNHGGVAWTEYPTSNNNLDSVALWIESIIEVNFIC